MENLEEKILDFLDGRLSTEERETFIQAMKENNQLKQAYDEMREFMVEVDDYKMELPTERLQSNFSNFLNKEVQLQKGIDNESSLKLNSVFNIKKLLPYATAAMALILLGVLFTQNYYQDKEFNKLNQHLKSASQEMYALLDHKSTSKRIEAVNISYDIPSANDAILDALIRTMNEDNSTNVRLAAVRALEKFTDNRNVVNAYIETLKIQKDPSVTISIIDILASIKEKKAIQSFEEMLLDDTHMEFVKDEVKVGLYKINSI